MKLAALLLMLVNALLFATEASAAQLPEAGCEPVQSLESRKASDDSVARSLTNAQLRIAAYNGKGRLTGMRVFDAADAQTAEDWKGFLDVPSNRAMLQGANADPKAATTGLSGLWTELERGKLGTLSAEYVDDESGNGMELTWQSQVFAGGPGLESVSSAAVGGTEGLDWDVRGRLLSVGQKSYRWSGDDRLLSVYVDGQEVEHRVYDAFGRAVRIKRGGVPLQRVFVGAEVVQERTGCAERLWWLTDVLDQPGAYTLQWSTANHCKEHNASFEAQLVAMDMTREGFDALGSGLWSDEGVGLSLLQDLHSDVVGLVDEQGRVLERYDYDVHGARTLHDAWGLAQDGEPLGACDSGLQQACGSRFGNTRGYTGAHLSGVTGFYDMRLRHYDPHLRVFASVDPLGFVAGFDLWLYVGGDPLNYIDPFGLKPEKKPRPERHLLGEEKDLSKLGADELTSIRERANQIGKFAGEHQLHLLEGSKIKQRDITGSQSTMAGNTQIAVDSAKNICDNIPGFSGDAALKGLCKDLNDALSTEAQTTVFPQNTVLNIGSGKNPMAGAVNVDIAADEAVDVVAAADALPFEDGVFTEAHAINPYGFQPVNSETARVLQPGALLYVTGTARNKYAQPISAEVAKAAGFELIETTPMLEIHRFGTQRTTSGGELKTSSSTTTVYRRLP